MRSSIFILVLVAFILTTSELRAEVTGQVTDVQISRITVRNGMMAVDVLHNGACGAPETRASSRAGSTSWCRPGASRPVRSLTIRC